VPHRLLAYVIVLTGLGGLVAESPAQAQSPLRIEAREQPLEAVLDEVRSQAGLDLVYADRLVQGRAVSCTFTGRDVAAALACILDGTGLQAERVRRRQYVIVSSESPSESRRRRAPLSGHVYDAETGERLPGAHVYLTTLKAGTTTNPDGYFVLSSLPRGPYDVEISYLGYGTVDTTLVAGRAPARIALSPAPIESEGVLVEGGPSNTEGDSQLPGMTAVALDRLDRLPSFSEPDLFRALQWTPGIRKSRVVSGGLSVRGGNPDQNLYLLDGAPVYHPWHAFSLISTFQTGTLKNTTLYRGGFPVEYGGRLSAVLDAQMKDGSRKKPSATAGIGVLSGRFRIEAPITSNTSFMLSGRRSYVDKLIGRTHPVTDETGRRDTLRTGYYFYDTSAKIAHRFNDAHRLTVSYYQGRDDLDLRLPFDLSLDFESWLRPADLFFELRQNWENQVVSARHQFLPRDDLFLTTTAYFSGYRAQEGSFVRPTTTASLVSDYRVRLYDTGLKIDANYHHSVSHEIGAGLSVSTLQFESTLDSKIERSAGVVRQRQQESAVGAVQVSGYLQDEWSPTPEWTLRGGLRASYFSGGHHAHLLPRLSARHTVHPRWLVLQANAGLHVQYLHRLRDRNSLAYDLVSSRWVPASDRVQPTTGAKFGLGARSQPYPGLTLRLDTYLRGTRDLLVPSDVFQEKDDIEGPGISVGALLGQYTTGEKRSVGAELSAEYNQGPWNARLGLGVGRTLVRAPGRLQSGLRWRPSALDVPVSLQSALGWDGGAWSATVAAEWRSGYPISAPVARYQVGDPVEDTPLTYLYRPQINNERLNPYVRVDLTLGYSFQFLSAGWTARLTLFNALNRDNELSRTYEPGETGVNVESQRGLPLLPLVEFEMHL
jgi:hypothetical protein